MAARPTSLAIENLESRLNLSTLAAPVFAAAPGFSSFTQDRALYKGTSRIHSLGSHKGAKAMFRQALTAVAGADSPAPQLTAAASEKTITLAWSNNAANESGFVIERSVDGINFSHLATVGASKSSFVDRKVALGVNYTYRVTAFNKSASGANSNTVSAALQPPAAPIAPTSVGPLRVTTSAVTLAWKDNAANESGYHVYRSTDGANFALVANLHRNARSFTDHNLAPDAQYTYEVAAWNPGGETASDAAAVSTAMPRPTAPIGLTVTGLSSNSLDLSWSEASPFVQGYRIYRASRGSPLTLVGNVDAGTTSFLDTSVSPSTRYNYVVSAWNSTADQKSRPLSITTLAASPLEAPANLTFSDVTTGSVTLAWTDATTTGFTGYNVYRSTDGANYALVVSLDPSTTQYTDQQLTQGTTYWYKVSAFDTSFEALSAPAPITTAVPATPSASTLAPAAPAGLAFSAVTSSSLTLNWNALTGNASGIHVYRSTDGTNFSLVGDLSSSATSWTDTSVQASTQYTYKVAAWSDTGETAAAPAAISTPGAAPAAPANVSFSGLTTSALTLNWTAPGNQAGYHVYRSTDGVHFSLAATLNSSATSWSDSNLASATTYVYEVGAYNATGETVSTPTTITTIAPPPVSISTQDLTSFSELVISGTTGNDSILVSQSGSTLSILANGQTYTETGTYGDIKILGDGGNDNITVASSVNISALVYGGDGNDNINNLTTGKATIVTLGNGTNTVTGNGINTSFWVNPADIVNASATEVALGGVNRVAGFFQPFSSSATSPNYIPRTLAGQNLPDPTDAGTTTRLTDASFWGTGPTMNDINQGSLSDCYFLAPLSSLAYSDPLKLMNMGVDLGDGTYAVRFMRNNTATYVRVDGDLPTGYWNGLAYQYPGANGNVWGSIFEKAYAFYRTSGSSSPSYTYSSLNWGYQGTTFNDLGLANSALTPSYSTDATVLSTINTQLAAGHAIAASTITTVKSGAPLIGSHVYSVIGAFKDSSGTVMIQVRNPWGVDGAGSDSNPYDGIVTIDFATFAANFNSLNWTTV